jgi:prepilin-type N-terminal cleavage/methylation domain-containing protein
MNPTTDHGPRSTGERRHESGFTLLELLVVLAIVALLASVAMAGYRQARMRSAESSAVTTLNTLNRGQFLFMQSCGKQHYAPTLVALATPAPGDEHGFVSPDLAVSDPLVKSGYFFELTGTPATEGEQTCTGAVPLDRYRITADPMTFGVSGSRYYGTNTDRVIYEDRETFRDNMPETGAPGHGTEIK